MVVDWRALVVMVLCFGDGDAAGSGGNGMEVFEDSLVNAFIQLGNLNTNLSFQTNYNPSDHDECGHYILLRAEDTEFKFREKPKGNCDVCCGISETDVTFLMYTRDGPGNGTVMSFRDIGTRRLPAEFNRQDTVIFVHGFLENPPNGQGWNFVDAYFGRDVPANVILVNWSELSSGMWYFNAIENVKVVATYLAHFLETYNGSGELPISKVHLVGFSLGAHVAGFAGKRLRGKLRIRRITGLDPAYPGFQNGKERLSEQDAEFVDVIHADGGNFGIPYPIGHADYFPNGGTRFQPGCRYKELAAHNLTYDIVTCNHQRAWRFYVDSVVNPKAYPSCRSKYWGKPYKKCNGVVDSYMGFAANENAHGIFYLETKRTFPYVRKPKRTRGL